MRKLFCTFLFVLIFNLLITNVNALELDVNSKNAIIYNLNDDTVLYEKKSDEKISIASMTKIMTAIVAIENINSLDDKITLTYADFYGLAEANAAVAGFYVDEVVTYRDLLYGLLLPSGADAAQALTRNISGGRENFVNLMNKKAQEIGLINTHFVNETGLDAYNHYSTVLDVASMFKYALKNDEFKKIIESKEYTTSDGYLTMVSTISKNTKRYGLEMDYLLGGKTGTTDDAGLCLASIASKDNVNYMLVTARATYDRYTPFNFYDAQKIYEYFMNNYSYKNVVDKKDLILTLDTLYAKEDKVDFYSNIKLDKYLSNDFNKEDLVYDYKGIKIIDTKMEKGTKLGVLNISYNDKIFTSIDIILDHELEFDLKKYIDVHKKEIIIIGSSSLFGLILFVFMIILIRKKAKKNK